MSTTMTPPAGQHAENANTSLAVAHIQDEYVSFFFRFREVRTHGKRVRARVCDPRALEEDVISHGTKNRIDKIN